MEELYLLYNWKTAVLFAIIIFVIRPLGVFVSTYKSTLSINEKLFISWVGPRGIVAAGIASLFGLKLAKEGVPGAEFITPLVFMVVLGTVLLNATTARLFARIVGVFLKKSEGILIIGASEVSRLIGKYLDDHDRHVVIIDSNQTNIGLAKELGLEALNTNIYTDNLKDNIELNDVGFIMALTGNKDINNYAINKYGTQFGENGAYRLATTEEMNDPNNNSKVGLFSNTDDFELLTRTARKFPQINEIILKDKTHYDKLIEFTRNDKDSIPLFLKDKDDELEIILTNSEELNKIEKGWQLVYLGKPIILK
jgi:Trk K+ transport system NAD-binding subunit